jgi:hydrogenase maturation protease
VECVGICDACQGIGQAGQTKRWRWPDDQIFQQGFSGSHDFGLADVLELARQLGRLPNTVIVWGIEIGTVTSQAGVSLSIQNIIPPLADEILQELLDFR